MPDPREILNNQYLRVFGSLLQDPNLWHLNRRSASGAFAVGLFMMYMPPVGQMFMAAAVAIKFRVNLPLSVSLVWVTNPLTIPPMFYLAYVIGALLLGQQVRMFDPHFWLDWHNWLGVVEPLLLGCLICGIVCSVTGYLTIQFLWRRNLLQQLARRRARYKAGKARGVAREVSGGVAGGVAGESPGVTNGAENDGAANKPSSSRQI